MNERIRELAEQAGFKVNWQHPDVQAIKMARVEKFAQLIIKECLEEVRDEVQYEHTWKLANSVAERVSKHFGVEE